MCKAYNKQLDLIYNRALRSSDFCEQMLANPTDINVFCKIVEAVNLARHKNSTISSLIIKHANVLSSGFLAEQSYDALLEVFKYFVANKFKGPLIILLKIKEENFRLYKKLIDNIDGKNNYLISNLNSFALLHQKQHQSNSIVLYKTNSEQIINHFLSMPQGLNKIKINEEEYEFNIGKYQKLRNQCFLKSKKCVCCQIQGGVLSLETTLGPSYNKFNLYAIKHGLNYLMTIDHIQPKSKNGGNTPENVQTMCSICNNIKSNHEISIEELRKARKFAELVPDTPLNTIYQKYLESKQLERNLL